MIKTLIVEDDAIFAEVLLKKVKQVGVNIQLVGIATTIDEAMEKIIQEKPQLLLLDVNIGSHTAFDLLKKLPAIFFEIIFITAYKDYAYDAFKYAAVDYIVKPCETGELAVALNKVAEKIKQQPVQKSSTKIAFATMEGTLFIPANEIIRCEGQRNYTHAFLVNKKKLVVSKNLKEVEKQLPEGQFFRIHHSHLINLSHIQKLIKADGGSLIMSDETEIPISRSKKDDFLQLFANKDEK